MQHIKKQQQIIIFTAIAILLITLFFGLKPKGYRFINQVSWLKGKNGISFTNIGMVYSKKTLGELGITDSITIIAALKPYHTGKRHSRILAIIDQNGNELFTVDQWEKSIEVSLWFKNRCRIARASIDDALSTDIVRCIAIGINTNELWVCSSDSLNFKEHRTIQLPQNFLQNKLLLIGFGAIGNNPWKGEMTGLSLSNRVLSLHEIYMLNNQLKNTANSNNAALKNTTWYSTFNETSGRIVSNHSQKTWNLEIPLFPKLFRHTLFELITKPFSINISFISDITINFLGFIPFGISFVLFFYSFKRTMYNAIIITCIAAFFVSTGIELFQGLFIPTRSSQLIDVVLNVGGAWFGTLIHRLTKYFV